MHVNVLVQVYVYIMCVRSGGRGGGGGMHACVSLCAYVYVCMPA